MGIWTKEEKKELDKEWRKFWLNFFIAYVIIVLSICGLISIFENREPEVITIKEAKQ